jgi:hypothetical protein
MNASGAPLGGGGSLHDIMRHISAQSKERKQMMAEITASTAKLADSTAELKAMAQNSVRQSAALLEQFVQAKSILEQLGPALLLRGGQRDQDQAQSSLGKRQREGATTPTPGGPTMDDAVSHGRNDTNLDTYRRERDRLTAEMNADAAARTATTTSSTSTSTSTNGNSVQQMRDLADVYLFGLQRVGALQDLRQAPDAILPGNFVEQPVVVAAAVTVASTTSVELATTKTTELATTTTATEGKTPIAVAASTETNSTAIAEDPKK